MQCARRQRRGQHGAGLQPVAQQVEERGFVAFTPRLDEVRRRHRRVQAGQTVQRPQRLQCGDVAVADQQFGFAQEQARVDAVQQPHRAVAAAQAVDGGHAVIGQRGVQVSQTQGVGAGQVARVGMAARVQAHAVAVAGIQGLHGGQGIRRDGAGGCDDADQVAFAQGVKTQGVRSMI